MGELPLNNNAQLRMACLELATVIKCFIPILLRNGKKVFVPITGGMSW